MDDFDMGLLDDTTYKVNVLRQKMLGIAPVFMYRIPKEKQPGEEYLYVIIVHTWFFVNCSFVAVFVDVAEQCISRSIFPPFMTHLPIQSRRMEFAQTTATVFAARRTPWRCSFGRLYLQKRRYAGQYLVCLVQN